MWEKYDVTQGVQVSFGHDDGNEWYCPNCGSSREDDDLTILFIQGKKITLCERCITENVLRSHGYSFAQAEEIAEKIFRIDMEVNHGGY